MRQSLFKTKEEPEGKAEFMEFLDRVEHTLEEINRLQALAEDTSSTAEERLRELGKIKGLCPEEIAISHALADVCTHAGRIYDAVRHQGEMEEGDSARGRVLFAQKIHRTREQLCQVFPTPKDGGWLLGFCLACEREGNGDEPSKCTHHDIHRLAVLAIAMLNIVPEYDLDVAAEMQGEDDA